MTWKEYDMKCGEILKKYPLIKLSKSAARMAKNMWKEGIEPKDAVGLMILKDDQKYKI